MVVYFTTSHSGSSSGGVLLSLLYFSCVLLVLASFRTSLGLEITRPKNGNSLYTAVGSSFSIACERDSLGQVTWYHNAAQLTSPYAPGLTITTSSEDGSYKDTSVLTRVGVVEADKGIYGCEAYSSIESVTVKLLDVKVKDGLVLKPRESVWLHCSDPEVPQGSDTYTVQWVREKDDFVISGDDEKYAYHRDNGSLEVRKVNYNQDLGKYRCDVLDPAGQVITSEQVNLTSVPYVRQFEERSKNLNKGSSLQLACNAEGFPEPWLYWKKDEADLDESDSRITISEDRRQLDIVNLNYGDRATYYCFGDSGEGRLANSSIMIRVKDPLAPLWPALGIVLELAILAVIILLYERHRARQRAEDHKEETELLTSGGGEGAANRGAGDAAGGRDDNMEMRKRKS